MHAASTERYAGLNVRGCAGLHCVFGQNMETVIWR